MRMKELVARSGLPRTTIHHYLREGLLPAPTRSSRNAAEYSEEHVERLRLIAALRSPTLGPLPLEGVRGVLAWVERGVTPAAAVGLHRTLGAPGGSAGEMTPEAASRRAGVELRRLRAWRAAGLLVPRPGPGGAAGGERYDAADIEMARRLAGLFEATGLEPGDLQPVAEMFREAAAYERTLAELAARALRPSGSESGGSREPDSGDPRAADAAGALVAGAMEGLYRYLRARGG